MLFSQKRKKEQKEPDGSSLSPFFFFFSEMQVWKTSVINFQKKLKQTNKQQQKHHRENREIEGIHFTAQGEKRW